MLCPRHPHQPVEHRHPKQGHKSDSCRDRKGHAPQRQRHHSPRGRHRHGAENERGQPERLEARVEEHGDQAQHQRGNERQPPAGREEIFEIPSPGDRVADRQRHSLGHEALRLGDKSGHIAAAHIRRDKRAAA